MKQQLLAHGFENTWKEQLLDDMVAMMLGWERHCGSRYDQPAAFHEEHKKHRDSELHQTRIGNR